VNSTKLVGIEFDADKQCKAQYGSNATFCTFSSAIKVSDKLLSLHSYIDASVRKYAHNYGASSMEHSAQPQVFHLLMVQAVDPPMYGATLIDLTVAVHYN